MDPSSGDPASGGSLAGPVKIYFNSEESKALIYQDNKG